MARGYGFGARTVMVGRKATVSELARPFSPTGVSIVTERVEPLERGREIGLLPGAGVSATSPRYRGPALGDPGP
ncbi:hypothetical protein BAY61_24265 [Prauserella marina]|uniref:Uncharacterized protein n=1 Tax=Prauserella marina TaxID=530584 RepID=A0A222VUM1_9PSEU|nr:hypothetical protein [Prauserella marina]ASR37605.1 hypothetical protein BAY61_24265 [Prauserella marina]PWV75513.1 hypothetical protein DES30_106128 [Prauserella marina]SDD32906.1 hypothetical protein SAMN05421630_107312 [Prauserella marina]